VILPRTLALLASGMASVFPLALWAAGAPGGVRAGAWGHYVILDICIDSGFASRAA